MGDIRTLLRDAAPAPAAPVQIAEIRARARRYSTRRLLAWIGGLGAAIGVGVPLGAGFVPTAGDAGPDATIEPRPPVDTTPTTEATPVTAEQTAGVDPSSTLARPAATPPDAVVPPTHLTPTSSAPPTTAPAGYPAASDCSVHTYGLDEGEARTCRFTATRSGGWNLYSDSPAPSVDRMPMVTVFVTRGREVTAYRSQRVDEDGETQYENCADDIIQPGDLVEVRVQQANVWIDGTEYDLGAGGGAGWGCTNRGPP